MSANANKDRPPFNVQLPTVGAAVAAIGGLTVALQFAVEAAIFPDRVKVDGESREARLDGLTKHLLREAKNALTEGVPDSDEARGIAAVIAIIGEITDGLRGEI